MIGNLLKTALSHFLKFHIFAFAVSVFVVMNSLVKQVLTPFFPLSDVHLNPGTLSFFFLGGGGVVFKRLFSVIENYLLKMSCSCHKFNYYFGMSQLMLNNNCSFNFVIFAQHLSYTFGVIALALRNKENKLG